MSDDIIGICAPDTKEVGVVSNEHVCKNCNEKATHVVKMESNKELMYFCKKCYEARLEKMLDTETPPMEKWC